MSTPSHPARLAVDHFDGRVAKAHRATMWLEGGMLQLASPESLRQIPLSQVSWPERTRHGPRVAHLANGGSLQALDNPGWDAWCQANGLGDSLVVRAQQSWRWSLLATALLLGVTLSAYLWGLPLAARAVVQVLPTGLDRQVGEGALHALDERLLHPSALPAASQEAIRRSLTQAVAQRFGTQPGGAPAYQLHFRRSRIGPNAFALPDGSIVLTDELALMLQDRPDVLLGVLGHELGHLRLRHGMRTLVQTGLLGAATSLALGDFSSVLASAPLLLGQLAYSRDFEREADDDAIAFLRANRIPPRVMVTLFERLTRSAVSAASGAPGSDDALGIAFRSHPADAERIRHFQTAAATPP